MPKRKRKEERKMTLSEKEHLLLKDMKGQEELCIEKYTRYAEMAKSPELKTLFEDLATTEREHLNTVNVIAEGGVPPLTQKVTAPECKKCEPYAYTPEDKKADALLLSDMLATEKHVSSLYNTSIFEFSSPELRATLNHIQTEEQQHGEKIYSYMKCNNMYS
jgi:spore coat protein CotF